MNKPTARQMEDWREQDSFILDAAQKWDIGHLERMTHRAWQCVENRRNGIKKNSGTISIDQDYFVGLWAILKERKA